MVSNGWMGNWEKVNPAAKLLNLLFSKEILVLLGEELVDPCMESHLLDPKFMLGSDKDPCNGEAGLFAVGARLVGFTIHSGRVVTKACISHIGVSLCNQIIQYLLFQGRPNGVGEHKNVLDLGLGVEIGMTGSPSDATVKPSKKVPCMRKVCGLFPLLHSHDIVRVWKEVVGHCVGYNCWKTLLLVIVTAEMKQDELEGKAQVVRE